MHLLQWLKKQQVQEKESDKYAVFSIGNEFEWLYSGPTFDQALCFLWLYVEVGGELIVFGSVNIEQVALLPIFSKSSVRAPLMTRVFFVFFLYFLSESQCSTKCLRL